MEVETENKTEEKKPKSSNLLLVLIAFLVGIIVTLAIIFTVFYFDLFGAKTRVINIFLDTNVEEDKDTDSEDNETPTETEEEVPFNVELLGDGHKFTVEGNTLGEYETIKSLETDSLIDDLDIQTLLEGEKFSLIFSLPYEAETKVYASSAEAETDFLEGMYRVKTTFDDYYKDYFFYTNDIFFKGSVGFGDRCSQVPNSASCGSGAYVLLPLDSGNVPSLYIMCKDDQQGDICNSIVKSLKITGKEA